MVGCDQSLCIARTRTNTAATGCAIVVSVATASDTPLRCPFAPPAVSATGGAVGAHPGPSRWLGTIKEAAGANPIVSEDIKQDASCRTRPVLYGRSDWIRTSGLLVPNQALYRTEPHPDLFCLRGATPRFSPKHCSTKRVSCQEDFVESFGFLKILRIFVAFFAKAGYNIPVIDLFRFSKGGCGPWASFGVGSRACRFLSSRRRFPFL